MERPPPESSWIAAWLAPLRTVLWLTLLTGVAYPLCITAIAHLVFPAAATGSVIERGGIPVGSRLIGQEFREPGHFWSRPSATGPIPYVAFDPDGPSGSSGSNLGPTSASLHEAVRMRVAVFLAAETALGIADGGPIPVDLVTASASGLDPHISIAGALRQVRRVAAARGLPDAELAALVDAHVERPWLGVLGEPVVNVLLLNLALDARVRSGR